MPMLRVSTATLVASLVLLAFAPARAQHEHDAATAADSMRDGHAARWHIMAQAIPVVTHAANTAEGADLTEGYLSQAAVMGRGDLLSGHLRLEATLNGEGVTMARASLPTRSA